MSRGIKSSPKCDCGSAKPLLAVACDRCRDLAAVRKPKREGVRARMDSFLDVKRACEVWLNGVIREVLKKEAGQ